MGRAAFLQEVEKFVAASKERIKLQVRKMGASCDWTREAYTLDESRSLAVRAAFKMLYDKGLIYRGDRIVNWCPRCGSTLADDEVEYRPQAGTLYYIKYPLAANPKSEIRNPKQITNPNDQNTKITSPQPSPYKGEGVVVATTRPETKLGDTALAVHPDDARYKSLVGKKFEVDLAGWKIRVKVVADKTVDPAFGTGVVGVTPAHSAADADLAQRHGLSACQVINEHGRMQEAGKYAGLKVKEAREALLADLKAVGLLEKQESIQNNLSICYRCHTPIEPLPKLQWFIDVNKEFYFTNSERSPMTGLKTGEKVTLKKLMACAVESGQIKIIPEHFEKIYFEWINNLRDWCISRQIWFGHRVPVYYCKQGIADFRFQISDFKKELKTINHKSKIENLKSCPPIVSVEKPTSCPACGCTDLEQDPDTLDTWFSSGLWTFSALGWPGSRVAVKSEEGKVKNDNESVGDLAKFHPTSVLETGYDILFFWIARMILMSTALLGEVPFRTVYLHGLVRDMQGRKMSKSLGNGIDPLDMIEKYGADAVRLSLFTGTSAGTDVKLNEQKIAGYRNFANKIWNASRFVLMNLDEEEKLPHLTSPYSAIGGSALGGKGEEPQTPSRCQGEGVD